FSFVSPRPPTSSTLSLHDALPISPARAFDQCLPDIFGSTRIDPVLNGLHRFADRRIRIFFLETMAADEVLRDRITDGHAVIHKRDRKSTRLNSSHVKISYAVFCLK